MTTPLPDPGFVRPIPGRVVIGSGWGPRDDHFHAGIDVKAETGTPVVAIAAGEVIRADASAGTPSDDPAGIHVAVRHANGMISRYLHFSRLDVKLGAKVAQGQQLGLSGNTGRSSGPHLHFELRVPAELLPRVQATVGKPTTGWGPEMSRYGWAIPSESWIPIDEFRTTTLWKLRSYGVPIYGERKPGALAINKLNPGVKVAGVGAFAALGILFAIGAYRRWVREP